MKRTFLVAKTATRQLNALKTYEHCDLFSHGLSIGSSVHQLDSFDVPTVTSHLDNKIHSTPITKKYCETKKCTNKNVPITQNTNLVPCPIVTDVPENPNKRRHIQITDSDLCEAGPSHTPDYTPFVIPKRVSRVPSWARIDEDDNAAPKGVAPAIPELAMPVYRTLRNAESKKAKAEVNLDFSIRYQTGRIVPKSYMVDVLPPIGRDDETFMNK